MATTRNKPLAAVKALTELAKNPDDLPKVFKIIESLPGRSTERILARMKASAHGDTLVTTKPNISALLSDRASLAAMPPGTLGRAYFELTERDRINAQGIVDASMAERERPLYEDPDVRFAGERMRDTHDLWHVVTGYGTDVVGELALLAFTYAQASHPGIGLIIGMAYLQFSPNINGAMREAWRRGRRSAWLPSVAWEQLLSRPLDEVRGVLRLDAPPSYTPIPTAALKTDMSIARRFWTRSFFATAQ